MLSVISLFGKCNQGYKKNKVKKRLYRFSERLESLVADNVIMLTGLKETLEPNRERLFNILKEMKEWKRKMTELSQGSG